MTPATLIHPTAQIVVYQPAICARCYELDPDDPQPAEYDDDYLATPLCAGCYDEVIETCEKCGDQFDPRHEGFAGCCAQCEDGARAVDAALDQAMEER